MSSEMFFKISFDFTSIWFTVEHMLNHQNYKDRVEQGKAGEKEILDVLRKAGIEIADATPSQDIYDKVDGWMNLNGTRVAVQVKFRESGDDVLFEIVKDIDKGIMGRDMRCKADYYLVKNTNGTIRMFLVAELKSKAKAIQDFVLGDLKKNPSKDSWGGNNVEVKIRVDKASGQRKLMAYFNPKKLKSFGEWQS